MPPQADWIREDATSPPNRNAGQRRIGANPPAADGGNPIFLRARRTVAPFPGAMSPSYFAAVFTKFKSK